MTALGRVHSATWYAAARRDLARARERLELARLHDDPAIWSMVVTWLVFAEEARAHARLARQEERAVRGAASLVSQRKEADHAPPAAAPGQYADAGDVNDGNETDVHHREQGGAQACAGGCAPFEPAEGPNAGAYLDTLPAPRPARPAWLDEAVTTLRALRRRALAGGAT